MRRLPRNFKACICVGSACLRLSPDPLGCVLRLWKLGQLQTRPFAFVNLILRLSVGSGECVKTKNLALFSLTAAPVRSVQRKQPHRHTGRLFWVVQRHVAGPPAECRRVDRVGVGISYSSPRHEVSETGHELPGTDCCWWEGP